MKVLNSEYKLKKEYELICKDIANTILTYNENSNLLSIKEIDKIIKSKSSYYKLPSIPKYTEILRFLPNDSRYKNLLRIKPVKTQSGVAVVTVMPMPYDCPHGKCIYCPGGIEYNTPLSYIGTEPATKVAQHVKYDAYEQVRTKIIQLMDRGHEVSKVELVIVGGTFPFYPLEYQIDFTKRCYDALNSFDNNYDNYNDHFIGTHKSKSIDVANKSQTYGDDTTTISSYSSSSATSTPSTFSTNHQARLFRELEKAKEKNETSSIRCVGLTVETKPDYCKKDHVDLMLDLGTTRIELGIQVLNEIVYKKVNRGHTLNDVYEAFFISRNSGYKIGAHMMPGLPGSSMSQDISDVKMLFEDTRLRPDMLKIYPTLVIPNTGLYELYKKNRYESYSTEDLVNLLVEIKKIIPPWVRIMRIQREVEPTDIVAGPKMGNIRQLVLNKLEREKIKCKCIRCREIGLVNENVKITDKDIELSRIDYNASGGKEVFLSFEVKNKNLLLGFLRLRLMSSPLRAELQPESFRSQSKVGGLLAVGEEKQDFGRIDFSRENETLITSAIVRELHVYGQVAKIARSYDTEFTSSSSSSSSSSQGLLKTANLKQSFVGGSGGGVVVGRGNDSDSSSDHGFTNNNKTLFNTSNSSLSSYLYQHKGLGKALLSEAEKICKEEYNLKFLSVISAVGTRDYYRKFGYTNNGPYVSKRL
ncbi:tRNA uridine(34) 5-carboxymethylaminomethyl modification radical SAM/GNAT enzyme Elp3 [Candidatus Nitrosocosmicus franklandus]|uniref:tRNA uridine(34) 5-carboxymethylaminomethyl modification radical SAM/GNAT enzyme Elp3 n=1 Tax=Candidatus Nitrosocosmicus franklandianus TaxID=1798806 RepID=UPI0015593168|nr:tRNA uridine(34) 5-carboxymethylaminomethyl modification radical SAM/GNAT enzyme Elp3 [Candidatus Nitrosocosmicus franklandus]